jgi:hypothetical protein
MRERERERRRREKLINKCYILVQLWCNTVHKWVKNAFCILNGYLDRVTFWFTG